jgi:hypothetical protein
VVLRNLIARRHYNGGGSLSGHPPLSRNTARETSPLRFDTVRAVRSCVPSGSGRERGASLTRSTPTSGRRSSRGWTKRVPPARLDPSDRPQFPFVWLTASQLRIVIGRNIESHRDVCAHSCTDDIDAVGQFLNQDEAKPPPWRGSRVMRRMDPVTGVAHRRGQVSSCTAACTGTSVLPSQPLRDRSH